MTITTIITFIIFALTLRFVAKIATSLYVSHYYGVTLAEAKSVSLTIKKPLKKTLKKPLKKTPVIFNDESMSSSKMKAKAEYDRIMAIPAYARKELGINYPNSL